MSKADDYKKANDTALASKPPDNINSGETLAIVLPTGGCSILKPTLVPSEALALADWLILNFK